MEENTKGSKLHKLRRNVRRYQLMDASYQLPRATSLRRTRGLMCLDSHQDLEERAKQIEQVLEGLKYPGQVVDFYPNAFSTTFVYEVGTGRRRSWKYSELAEEVASGIGADWVRIKFGMIGRPVFESTRGYLGLEVPNSKRQELLFGNAVSQKSTAPGHRYSFPVGVDSFGGIVSGDLRESLVCSCERDTGKNLLDEVLVSLVLKEAPEELGLVLMDFCDGSLGRYEGLPHLIMPVVSDAEKAQVALSRVMAEMEDRLRILYSPARPSSELIAARRRMPLVLLVINGLDQMLGQVDEKTELAVTRILQIGNRVNVRLFACMDDTFDSMPRIMRENLRGFIELMNTDDGTSAIAGRRGVSCPLMIDDRRVRASMDSIKVFSLIDEEIEPIVAFAAQRSEPEFQRRMLPDEEESSGCLEAFSSWDKESSALVCRAFRLLEHAGDGGTIRQSVVSGQGRGRGGQRGSGIAGLLASHGLIRPRPDDGVCDILVSSFDDLVELARG